MAILVQVKYHLLTTNCIVPTGIVKSQISPEGEG